MYDVVVPAAMPITESNVANLMQGQQQQQQNPNLMSMSGDNFGSAVSRSLELGMPHFFYVFWFNFSISNFWSCVEVGVPMVTSIPISYDKN
jgi:hypothetical protein